MIAEITASLSQGGGYFFFVASNTRATTPRITRQNWNSSEYVTISISPFLPKRGNPPSHAGANRLQPYVAAPCPYSTMAVLPSQEQERKCNSALGQYPFGPRVRGVFWVPGRALFGSGVRVVLSSRVGGVWPLGARRLAPWCAAFWVPGCALFWVPDQNAPARGFLAQARSAARAATAARRTPQEGLRATEVWVPDQTSGAQAPFFGGLLGPTV